jgi:hypothetical protein
MLSMVSKYLIKLQWLSHVKNSLCKSPKIEILAAAS